MKSLPYDVIRKVVGPSIDGALVLIVFGATAAQGISSFTLTQPLTKAALRIIVA